MFEHIDRHVGASEVLRKMRVRIDHDAFNA